MFKSKIPKKFNPFEYSMVFHGLEIYNLYICMSTKQTSKKKNHYLGKGPYKQKEMFLPFKQLNEIQLTKTIN